MANVLRQLLYSSVMACFIPVLVQPLEALRHFCGEQRWELEVIAAPANLPLEGVVRTREILSLVAR